RRVEVAERTQLNTRDSDCGPYPRTAKRLHLSKTFGRIHGVDVAIVARVAAEFGDAWRQRGQEPYQGVHADQLRIRLAGVALAIDLAPVFDPRCEVPQGHVKVTRDRGNGRSGRLVAVDVLVRIDVHQHVHRDEPARSAVTA